MKKISIAVLDKEKKPRFQEFSRGGVPINKTFQHTGHGSAYLGSRFFELQEGDSIQIETESSGTYVVVRFDETLLPSLVYIKDKIMTYPIPTEAKALLAYRDGAFKGEQHLFTVRYATEEEISRYQNLALNTHDQNAFNGSYPHASANVETRNDSTFFASNAIDGVLANDDHGNYPYQSWGINKDPNAELTLEFGREVEIDSLGIVLRADFPHDSWWKQVTFEFSDGSEVTLDLDKTDQLQKFTVEPRIISWLKFKNLIKGDDVDFPALTQLEVYGKNL